MPNHEATPNKSSTARETPREASPARQFAYEMAFDSRFQGLRWSEVESQLAAEYAGWLERHQPGGARVPWDRVKGEVREAWEAALDVEHAGMSQATGAWEERAQEYRRMWEANWAAGGSRWDEVEPAYRYVDAMGTDPRYLGRPWPEVGPRLEAGFPVWAASHGYRIAGGPNPWDRLRDLVKHAWEHLPHRRRSA